MISFETYWFFLLTPLPWLIYAWLPAVGDQSPALRVPFTDDLASLTQQTQLSSGKSPINILLLTFIWLCLLVAVNRPIATGDAIQLPTEARDMMLAVDISGSMEERDMMLNGKNVRQIGRAHV